MRHHSTALTFDALLGTPGLCSTGGVGPSTARTVAGTSTHDSNGVGALSATRSVKPHRWRNHRCLAVAHRTLNERSRDANKPWPRTNTRTVEQSMNVTSLRSTVTSAPSINATSTNAAPKCAAVDRSCSPRARTMYEFASRRTLTLPRSGDIFIAGGRSCTKHTSVSSACIAAPGSGASLSNPTRAGCRVAMPVGTVSRREPFGKPGARNRLSNRRTASPVS